MWGAMLGSPRILRNHDFRTETRELAEDKEGDTETGHNTVTGGKLVGEASRQMVLPDSTLTPTRPPGSPKPLHAK